MIPEQIITAIDAITKETSTMMYRLDSATPRRHGLAAAFDPSHPRWPDFADLRSLHEASAPVRDVIEMIRVNEDDPDVRRLLSELGHFEIRENWEDVIQPGRSFAKLMFVPWRGSPEAMWVRVQSLEDGVYTGILDNHSDNDCLPRLGDSVSFEAKHVITVIAPDHNQDASDPSPEQIVPSGGPATTPKPSRFRALGNVTRGGD
jgi:hypothetical protein